MENVDQVNSGPGLLAALWRYRMLVTVVTVLAGLTGYGLSLLQPTLYEGSAKLLLSDPRGKSVFQPDRAQPVVLDPSRAIRNRAEVITSRPVIARAATELGRRGDVDQLLQRVSAEPSAELDLITVHALDPTPKGAAALADAVARAYQFVAAQQVSATAQKTLRQLDRSNTQLRTRIAKLERRIGANPGNASLVASLVAERDAAVEQLRSSRSRADQIAVEAGLLGSGVDFFEPARVPTSPAQPHSFGAALLGVMLGFLGVGAFAWWRAEHTQVASARQDAATVLKTSLLGEVPEFSTVGVTGLTPAQTAPKSVAGEAYQFLVSSLEFSLSQSRGRTVLITSAGPTDGKTVTALNLAISAMRGGRRVLLVDADERARGLTKLTGVPSSPGLTDLANGELPLGAYVSDYRLDEDQRLPMVPAGSPLAEPGGFFRSPGFRKALSAVKEQADLVIVDSPPLLAVADTSAIASQADGIVVVVSRGTRLRVLEEVRERLEFIGTPVLGYVFNRADLRRGRSYGRYGRYGRYGGYGGYGETRPSSNGSPAGEDRQPRSQVRQ
ncbi:MAG TPA: AAA family ATPase [Actinomycetes bacterium]|nr:AAA family ATPase [Actinomycetes bacterium]